MQDALLLAALKLQSDHGDFKKTTHTPQWLRSVRAVCCLKLLLPLTVLLRAVRRAQLADYVSAKELKSTPPPQTCGNTWEEQVW